MHRQKIVGGSLEPGTAAAAGPVSLAPRDMRSGRGGVCLPGSGTCACHRRPRRRLHVGDAGRCHAGRGPGSAEARWAGTGHHRGGPGLPAASSGVALLCRRISSTQASERPRGQRAGQATGHSSHQMASPILSWTALAHHSAGTATAPLAGLEGCAPAGQHAPQQLAAPPCLLFVLSVHQLQLQLFTQEGPELTPRALVCPAGSLGPSERHGKSYNRPGWQKSQARRRPGPGPPA